MADLENAKSYLERALSAEGGLEIVQEATDTLEAIRSGQVDAFVMQDGAEEQVYVLRGAYHPYRLFVERMNEGAVTLSTDGVILYANQCFADMVKIPVDQIRGVNFADFVIQKDSLQSILETETASRSQLELQASDGTMIPAYISYSRLRSGEQAWTCFIVIDLTADKRQQAVLKEAQDLAVVGKAAAVLCHEIAGPLNAMSTTVQLMQRRLLASDAGKFVSEMQDLNSEIFRLSELLNNFRFLSSTHLNLVSTDLPSLITESVKIIAAQAAEGGIHVEQEFSADLPPITLDKDKIKQVLFNLYRNAIEAMSGGGTLTIKTIRAGDSVVIEIRDTGAGISAAIDVFEVFTTTKANGTGLGLAIVRQIVAAHAGKITYTTEAGEGTSFYISLPLDQP
jgi:PAS domain S-box-containing protein